MPGIAMLANYLWLMRPWSPGMSLLWPVPQNSIISNCTLNTDPYTTDKYNFHRSSKKGLFAADEDHYKK